MRSVFVLAAALVLSAPVVAQKADPTPRPLIGGAWTLNRELSSTPRGGGADPADRMRSSGGGMRGGIGLGGMSSGRGGGSGPDREEMARRRALMKEVLEAPKTFVITVEEPMVIFTYTDGRRRALQGRRQGREAPVSVRHREDEDEVGDRPADDRNQPG